MKKYIRKLTKMSTHSYVLNIPKELIREFKWREKQKLEIVWDEKSKKLIIKDWKK